MNLNDSIEQRALKNDALSLILETSKGRDLTEDETKQFDTLADERDALDTEIVKLQAKEARDKRIAQERLRKVEKKTPEAKAKEAYSMKRMIQAHLPGGKLDGVEKEMDEEARREASIAGVSMNGVGIPGFMIGQERDLNVGTAIDGGHTVETELWNMIPILRAKLQALQLGVQLRTGLRGDVDIPRNDLAGTATWGAEAAAATEATQTFDKLSMSPNRLDAYSYFSRDLLNQSTVNVNQFVSSDLIQAQRIAVDAAILNGSGANTPGGILGTSGIGDVAIGANGGFPTFASLIDLETEITTDNAEVDNMAYLVTPGVRGYLKQTLLDAGSGQFIWGQGANSLNGYKVATSTQVPATLTKGINADCHAIMFGDWSQGILGQWGGMDLLVDPYSKSLNGQIQIVAYSWWDFVLRHAESMAAILDARIVA